MRGACALLLVPFFLFAAPRAALSLGDVEVLEADAAGVIFVYNSPRPDISSLLADQHILHTVVIEGCGHLEEAGKPWLPVKYVHLGVPTGSQVRMTVLGTEDSTLTDLTVAPVPKVGGDSISSYSWRTDEEFYSRDRVYPEKRAEVVEVGLLRNQRVAKLRLFPCQYNPRKRRLTWHRKLRVRVDFSPGRGKGVPILRRDPFEPVYRSTLLNYEQAKSFRRAAPSRAPVLLQQGPWYKLSTVKEGLYRITYSDLEKAGISPGGVDPRTIKIYNGGSRVLPYELSAPKPDTIPYQIAIYVRGEEDGSLDEEDYILFYGLSLHGWGKNVVPDYPSGDVSLYYNPYADTNCYWLTWGGERGDRMTTRDGSIVHFNPYEPSTFEDTAHVEEDRLCPAHSGFGWIWDAGLLREESKESVTRDYWAEVHGVAGAETSRTVFALYGADSDYPLNHAVRIRVNGELYSDTVWAGSDDRRVFVYGRGLGVTSGLNRFTIEIYRDSLDLSADNIYLDYFEVFYRREYDARENRLKFSTSGNPIDTTYEFSIGNLGEYSVVLDVTDPFRPVRLLNLLISPSRVRFQDRVDTPRAYFGACDFLSPLRITRSWWRSLRDFSGVDWVAICYDSFLDALGPLTEWRKSNLLGIANPAVRAVKLSEVYDNFSWGIPDVTAIRDFLKYAYENWNRAPAWCFLVGAGTFDYKNRCQLANRKNFMPPYESGDDVVGDFSLLHGNWSYDDWFVHLTGDDLPDIAIGRTTVESSQETRWVADKVVEYEKGDLGVWRNRVLLIADDEFASGTTEEIVHTQDTERLYQLIPRDVDVVKVYLMEYERVGGDKPDARDDIVKYIDEGVLAGSFLGHGSYRRLTHETVVLNPRDINALRNQGRQPFFYYGSCEVGEFEREGDRSLADYMQKQRDRGGIATLGATRTTWCGPNYTLGSEILTRLLGDSAVTIGDVTVAAKVAASGTTDRLYVLFGDPATKSGLPELNVGLTLSSDTLKGGQPFRVSGAVPSPLSGYACLTAFDSEVDTFHTTPGGRTVSYVLPGSPIFKGMASVGEGGFSQSFIVPLDLEQGNAARVSCYVWDGSRTGHGAADSLVCGIDSIGADISGPELSLLINGQPADQSSYVPPNSELVGLCSDESGINITSQQGVSMSLVIDGNVRDAIPLYEHFAYDFGSYTSGRFSYTLPALETDTSHSLRVRVSDNLKNVTTDSAVVNISSAEELELRNVMNYPNPFSKRTWFTFELNQPARVIVRVYTVRGRLIRVIEEPNCKDGFNKIPRDGWEGLDEEGDPVANGVYLYKLVARAERRIPDVALPREMKAEVIEKLVVMR